MKRPYETVYAENEARGYEIGDAEAHRAAAALADRADAPTLRAFGDMLTLLERVGGQAHVTAVRTELEGGEFRTVALGFNYDTIDARVREIKPPEEVMGFPITRSDGPPTEVPAESNGHGGPSADESPPESEQPPAEPAPEPQED